MKILAYGTLRKHDYNFSRIKEQFGEDSIKYIEDIEIPGFKMVNLGFYPAVTSVEDQNSKIKCEVLEVSSEAAGFIDTMEWGAGYQRKEIDGARIYTMDLSPEEIQSMLIPSGDWKNKSTEKR